MGNRRVLVTGVAGLMGSHLAERLVESGAQVVGLDNLIGGYRDNVPGGVEFHEVDVTDLENTRSLYEGVDTVIHAACTAYEGLSVFSPALITRNTSLASACVYSNSIHAGVEKVIYLSSMARYGEQEKCPFDENMVPSPQDPYGIAKLESEMLLRNLAQTHGFNYVIIVPHNIIGPRQKYDDPYRNVAAIMINRMLRGLQPIIYGTGNQRRCFSFMDDVTDPILKCVNSDVANGLVVNIGPDDEFITINELASKLSNILGFEEPPIYVPGRPQEVENANCSADLAREILDYQPGTNLEQGLRQLVDWIKFRGARDFEYSLPIEFVTPLTPKTWTDKLM